MADQNDALIKALDGLKLDNNQKADLFDAYYADDDASAKSILDKVNVEGAIKNNIFEARLRGDISFISPVKPTTQPPVAAPVAPAAQAPVQAPIPQPGIMDRAMKNAGRSLGSTVDTLAAGAFGPTAPIQGIQRQVNETIQGYQKGGVPGAILGAVAAPFLQTSDMITGAAKHIGKLVSSPRESFAEDPFGTIVDVASAVIPEGMLARAGGGLTGGTLAGIKAARSGGTFKDILTTAWKGMAPNSKQSTSPEAPPIVEPTSGKNTTPLETPVKSARESASVFAEDPIQMSRRRLEKQSQPKPIPKQLGDGKPRFQGTSDGQIIDVKATPVEPPIVKPEAPPVVNSEGPTIYEYRDMHNSGVKLTEQQMLDWHNKVNASLGNNAPPQSQNIPEPPPFVEPTETGMVKYSKVPEAGSLKTGDIPKERTFTTDPEGRTSSTTDLNADKNVQRTLPSAAPKGLLNEPEKPRFYGDDKGQILDVHAVPTPVEPVASPVPKQLESGPPVKETPLLEAPKSDLDTLGISKEINAPTTVVDNMGKLSNEQLSDIITQYESPGVVDFHAADFDPIKFENIRQVRNAAKAVLKKRAEKVYPEGNLKRPLDYTPDTPATPAAVEKHIPTKSAVIEPRVQGPQEQNLYPKEINSASKQTPIPASPAKAPEVKPATPAVKAEVSPTEASVPTPQAAPTVEAPVAPTPTKTKPPKAKAPTPTPTAAPVAPTPTVTAPLTKVEPVTSPVPEKLSVPEPPVSPTVETPVTSEIPPMPKKSASMAEPAKPATAPKVEPVASDIQVIPPDKGGKANYREGNIQASYTLEKDEVLVTRKNPKDPDLLDKYVVKVNDKGVSIIDENDAVIGKFPKGTFLEDALSNHFKIKKSEAVSAPIPQAPVTKVNSASKKETKVLEPVSTKQEPTPMNTQTTTPASNLHRSSSFPTPGKAKPNKYKTGPEDKVIIDKALTSPDKSSHQTFEVKRAKKHESFRAEQDTSKQMVKIIDDDGKVVAAFKETDTAKAIKRFLESDTL